jgi:hypothetical protein
VTAQDKRLDDERLRPLVSRGEPVGGERGEIERRLPADHELREMLAHCGRLLEAVPGESGRIEEARHLA